VCYFEGEEEEEEEEVSWRVGGGLGRVRNFQ
jgi:hypothetical protein